MNPTSLTSWLERLAAIVDDPLCVWAVGGAVRDDLLGRETVDFDFAVRGEARRLARRIANSLSGDYYDLDRQRDAGRVLIRRSGDTPQTMDFATLRGETIEADLASRDFTLNAMARSLGQPDRILDPLGGQADLRQRVLRACSQTAIKDDPVRALRAVRLAHDFGLRIEPQTLRQMEARKGDLQRVTAERLRDEFLRILDAARPSGAIRVLDHLGLLTEILPELESLRGLSQPAPHAFPALEHTLSVIDHLGDVLGVLGETTNSEAAADLILGELSLRLGRFRIDLARHLDHVWSFGRRDRQLLCLASLLHDIGKPETAPAGSQGEIEFLGHESRGAALAVARSQAMRLSSIESSHVGQIIAQHMRPESLQAAGGVSRRAAYRFFRDSGEAGIDVVLLSLADFLGKFASVPPPEEWAGRLGVAQSLLEARFSPSRERLNPPRLIRGDRLAEALGITPGPELGRLLEAIREAQASGEVVDEVGAIELARRLIGEATGADNR